MHWCQISVFSTLPPQMFAAYFTVQCLGFFEGEGGATLCNEKERVSSLYLCSARRARLLNTKEMHWCQISVFNTLPPHLFAASFTVQCLGFFEREGVQLCATTPAPPHLCQLIQPCKERGFTIARSQSIFYLMPQESLSQAGSWLPAPPHLCQLSKPCKAKGVYNVQ